MSSYTSIAAALKTLLEAIPNIGQVHAYRRWNADWSTYLDHTKTTLSGENQVRVWMVTRESLTSSFEDSFRQARHTHSMVIVGALGLNDSDDTYTKFQELLDLVVAALDAKRDLSASDIIDYSIGAASVRTIGEEALGSVLCHVAEIEVSVITLSPVTFS